ncbi:MAG: non-canonical purine NTP pyrophosphatase [Candidatus Lambdaproteobacteria bacterium]|nr:non-canonical purine NTP pyrophosphatase [Candidatus Lambdaproteobacteria bacterium]
MVPSGKTPHAPSVAASVLLFVTSNADKLREAQEILRRPVVGCALELEELQTTDLAALVRHKAAQAYAAQRRPLFVEDTALSFRAWGALPGPFIKFFLVHLGPAGLVRALEPFGDMAAEAVCGVGYHDGTQVRYFEGRVTGAIVSPAGVGGFGWDAIFRPQGHALSFAQMDAAQKHALSMRASALRALARYLDG